MSQLRLTLKGHGPYDGVYDLDFDAAPITKREWHWFKEIADIRPGQMAKAVQEGDQDLDVVFSVMAVVREGKANKNQWQMLADFFLDSPGEIEAEEVGEDDAGPPDLATQPPLESGSNEKKKSSSDSSNGTGDATQAIDLASTGQLS